jgi:hypothetical protein
LRKIKNRVTNKKIVSNFESRDLDTAVLFSLVSCITQERKINEDEVSMCLVENVRIILSSELDRKVSKYGASSERMSVRMDNANYLFFSR